MSMGDWAKLVTAAGVNVRNMEPIEVYQMAGKILTDRRVLDLTLASQTSRECVMLNMSLDERAALRERISGVIGINRSGK
jgi:hypothetical protein